MSKGIEMKHNGIEYKEETLHDVTRYDGGAMGGIVKKMPSKLFGVFCDGIIAALPTFEQAADAAQAMQRKRYEESRAFVMQYEKEARE